MFNIAFSYKSILKDPLIHFLAIGAVLFVILNILRPPALEDRIVVDREALLTFIQYRSKAFEPDVAAALLDAMSEEERQRLIDDYIREEALYREARKLGFDEGDYVIRRRMVQKLEFMSEAATAGAAADDTALAEYFDQHRGDYYLQPDATFAHVYIAGKGRSAESAMQEAMALLEMLTASGAKFADATRYGDRFLYHTNYVERTFDYIKSHFGAEAAEEIFSDDKVALNKWSGPIASEHGLHLFYVTERNAGRVPPLSEVKSRVAKDLAQVSQQKAKDELVNAIVENYAPIIDLENNESESTAAPAPVKAR